MKYRLNKAFYAQLPAALAQHVREWAGDSRVRHVSVAIRRKVFIQEDATYTAFSPDCAAQTSARAAGEWAGATGLRPSAECEIPPGCTLVESGLFLGRAFLNVFHNDAMPIAGELASKSEPTTSTARLLAS